MSRSAIAGKRDEKRVAGRWAERYRAFVDEHEAAWELAFAGLAVLFVVLGTQPDSAEWVAPLEWALTAVFLAEFLSRLAVAPSRRDYLRGHWVDLVALVPPVRGLRVLRLVRLLRLVRAFAGVARAVGSVESLARHRGLVWLVTGWATVVVLASIGLYVAEKGINHAIDEPFDALWWGVVTMTTVGYGDVYPVTSEGRVAAMILMVLGIALFSAVTAVVTSFLLSDRTGPEEQLSRLAELRDRGLLTDEEFEVKRRAAVSRI